MIVRDSVFLALRAITAHRLRSFLTLAGIAVGIAAVILLTSIGEGIHRYMLSEFSQFGTNVIGISPGKVKVGGGPPSGLPTSVRPLTIDDAVALERIPNIVGSVPTAWGNSEVAYGGRTRRTMIYGVSSAADRGPWTASAPTVQDTSSICASSPRAFIRSHRRVGSAAVHRYRCSSSRDTVPSSMT